MFDECLTNFTSAQVTNLIIFCENGFLQTFDSHFELETSEYPYTSKQNYSTRQCHTNKEQESTDKEKQIHHKQASARNISHYNNNSLVTLLVNIMHMDHQPKRTFLH